jgi:DNA-binding transcriptional ArsR family regulator
MSQDSGKNPYRPGVGVRPLYLAGREGPLGRFAAMLRAAPEQQASMRVTGLRGAGKTVLLEEFADHARQVGWEPAFLELQPSHNTDAALRQALGSLLERTRERLSRLERLRKAAGRALRAVSLSVSWEDVSLAVSFGSEREEQLARELFATIELALAKGRTGVVLLLDEAQLIRDERDRHGEHPLSLLIAPVVALQRHELPLALVLCGLPTLTGNLQKARSYSERLFRGEEIGSLAPEQALKAFIHPLDRTARTSERKLALAVVEEVEGYPYFLQLWGSELWDAADLAGVERFTTTLLDATRLDIYARLDRDFYEPRIATLTPAEQDLLGSSASCPYPPLRVADLTRASNKTPGNVNVLLGRLVDAGALYRIRKGEYAYTAPRIHDYLLRRAANRPAGY